jgi:ABC-type uncharacterized transport system permease subunit
MAILGKLSFIETVWGIIFPIIAFSFSHILWRKGIKKYISANG